MYRGHKPHTHTHTRANTVTVRHTHALKDAPSRSSPLPFSMPTVVPATYLTWPGQRLVRVVGVSFVYWRGGSYLGGGGLTGLIERGPPNRIGEPELLEASADDPRTKTFAAAAGLDALPAAVSADSAHKPKNKPTQLIGGTSMPACSKERRPPKLA
jgi:hypothetical protein